MDYRNTLTTCTYCGCGCNLYLESVDGRLTGTIPCKTSPVNEGKLCIKGWNVHEFVQSDKRLQKPLLKKEGRLLKDTSGDNTDCSLNFIPKMNYETLITGYKKILHTIYLPKHYYKRVRTFLRNYKPEKLGKKIYFKIDYIKAFLNSAWVLGIKGRERIHFWGLILWTLVRRPKFFGISIAFAIYGFHFRKISGK